MRAPHLSLLVFVAFPATLSSTTSAAALGKLRLAFEPRGSGPRQQYVARSDGYSIAVRSGGATIFAGTSRIELDFAGGREVPGIAGDELPGKVNYVSGSDPKKWQIGLPTYGSITYREIYPGVDVVYRGNQGQMEFDLLLRARADAGRIRLRFSGAQRLSLDETGGLVVHHAQGDLHLKLPTIYQDVHGSRKLVRGRYALLPNFEVTFRLETYDHSEPLVIDPMIVYTYFLGNTSGYTSAAMAAVDSGGNTYIAGKTSAAGLSNIANAGLSPVQLTPCNVAQTTVASVADVQSVINEALGVAPLAHDLNHDGVVNLVDTQIVWRFVLDYQCRTQ